MSTDRIEKSIVLNAPREQVWRALSDAARFGTWFGVRFDGPFTAGSRLTGRIVPTQVDPEVARHQQPYEGTAFDFWVDRVEPMERIAFRWHPYAHEPGKSYDAEPTTLIVFELHDASGGAIRLTVTESGFDQLPADRRVKAFEANDGGWAMQMILVQKYLALSPAAPAGGPR